MLCIPANRAQAQDPDRVRTNIAAFYSASGANTSDPAVIQALSSLQGSASNAQSSMQANGSWTDINYAEVPSGSFSPSSHYGRLLTMAKAYQTAGQALYHDATLAQAFSLALAYIETVFPSGCPKPGNWWFWDIGIPMQLGPALILMRDQIDPALLQQAIASMNYFIGATPTLTGANLVWECINHLYYASLTNDAARLEVVRQAMESVAVISNTEEGIMVDFSFHQHGAQLYTGGYGAAFGVDTSRYQLFSAGTSAQLSEHAVDILRKYAADATRWSLYQKFYDPAVIGREITRSNKDGVAGLAAIIILATLDGVYQPELIAASKQMLLTWTNVLASEYAGLVSGIQSSATPAAWPSGHRHYPDSDYSIHRRSDYYASYKMLSNRIISAELVNDEGKKSWHLSDGYLYLVLKGDEYFSNNVWPTLDWTRLPGTTVEQKSRQPGEGFGKGTRSFVGGVSDGQTGVAAMDFAANASGFTARKSVFFFDDAVVCLGTDIQCATDNPVETTVSQWPMSSLEAPITVDSAVALTNPGETITLEGAAHWLQADGIGYYFPVGQTVSVGRLLRSGAWSDLGIGTSTSYQNTFLTIWMSHGAHPNRAQYAYVLLPRKSTAEVDAWSKSPGIEILAQTSEVHAVRHIPTQRVGTVFWNAGSVDVVQVSAPCTLLYQSQAAVFQLAASDPGHGSTVLQVEVSQRLTPQQLDTGVSSEVVGESTRIRFTLDKGRTLSGIFNRENSINDAGSDAGGDGANSDTGQIGDDSGIEEVENEAVEPGDEGGTDQMIAEGPAGVVGSCGCSTQALSDLLLFFIVLVLRALASLFKRREPSTTSWNRRFS